MGKAMAVSSQRAKKMATPPRRSNSFWAFFHAAFFPKRASTQPLAKNPTALSEVPPVG